MFVIKLVNILSHVCNVLIEHGNLSLILLSGLNEHKVILQQFPHRPEHCLVHPTYIIDHLSQAFIVDKLIFNIEIVDHFIDNLHLFLSNEGDAIFETDNPFVDIVKTNLQLSHHSRLVVSPLFAFNKGDLLMSQLESGLVVQ